MARASPAKSPLEATAHGPGWLASRAAAFSAPVASGRITSTCVALIQRWLGPSHSARCLLPVHAEQDLIGATRIQ